MKKNQQQLIQAIIPADIDWREGQPYSRQFNDVYFSKHNGLDETTYVFLQQNQLNTRCQQAKDFVIAEMGFGTGLNFLAACRLWLDVNAEHTLYFVSVDKHPLKKQDVAQALQSWPELSDYTDELLAHYPSLTPGWHHISLFAGRIVLTLYFGEANAFLQDSSFKANAWFLDGFAPSQNQSMWADDIYTRISSLSQVGATFATYTAAGHVRRGLQAAGFTVQKTKGYANKRELLYGYLAEQIPPSSLYSAADCPWFHHLHSNNTERRITIIGAGLAGAFTAHIFAQRGYQVSVIEAEKAVAQKASGNKQAMIYCRFSAHASQQYHFYHQAYLHSLALLQGKPHVMQTGLLDIAYDDKSQLRYEQLYQSDVWPKDIMQLLDAEEASRLLGLPVKHKALHMQQGGYVNPVRLCEDLLSHKNIELHLNKPIKNISYSDAAWQLFDQQSSHFHSAPLLVLTTAEACLQFEQLAYLPLKRIRGQVSHLLANAKSKRLQMPICYEGYLAPEQNGLHSLGASFNLHDSQTTVNQKDDYDNMAKLQLHLPDLCREMQLNEADIHSSRVGFRCHSPDYLPVVGPLPDTNFFEHNYAGLGHGQLKKRYKQGKFKQGLFINVAHGSRGVVSTPLSAELLYSYVHNAGVFPVGESVRHALHPARFLIKNIKHNK